MAARKHTAPLRTGGKLWGPERVRLGVSIRTLEKRSGVARGLLAFFESGRMIPTGDEYDAVMRALDEFREPRQTA